MAMATVHRVERRLEVRNLNVPFILALVALAALTGVLAGSGADPRLLGALYGAAGLGGITYRLCTTWHDNPVLVHVLALLLAGFLLLGAVASMQLSGHGPGALDVPPPVTSTTWPAVFLRLAVIVVAVFWPRWTQQRHSPFRHS